ncbi:unnamed protein product, partial [marine sediment metagenome]
PSLQTVFDFWLIADNLKTPFTICGRTNLSTHTK